MNASRIFYRSFSEGLGQKLTKKEKILERIYEKINNEKFKIGSELPKGHIYKSLYPWNSLEEFSKHLIKNIVYNQHGLIAINKPYGVGAKPFQEEPLPFDQHNLLVNKTIAYSHQPACHFYLTEALPYLREMLDMKDLDLIKTTDRYSSGITLFSASPKVASYVQNSLKKVKPLKIPHLGYLVICQGYPNLDSLTEKVGVAFEVVDVSESGNPIAKQPYIVSNPSKSKIKNKQLKPIHVSYSTISTNKELAASLLEMHCTTNKSHFLRIYITHKASCILGDVLFGSRVATLMGKQVTLPINTSIQRDLLPLSKSLAERLLVPAGSQGQSRIPTMMHHHHLLLKGFLKGKKDLSITAPPPPHFSWTCSQLDLKLDIKEKTQPDPKLDIEEKTQPDPKLDIEEKIQGDPKLDIEGKSCLNLN